MSKITLNTPKQPTAAANPDAKKLILILALSLLSLNASASTLVRCQDNATGGISYSQNWCYGNSTLVAKYLNFKWVSEGLWSDNVFASKSFWYQDISKAPIDANSANLVIEFMRQKVKYYNTVNLNMTQYAAPVYIVNGNVPSVKVGFNNCQNKSYTPTEFLNQVSAVPIPAHALAANGTDAEIAVYKPSTGEYWELWEARKDASGNWSACWGGKVENTKLSDGVFPSYYGTTATSLPFIGGQITAEELKRGEIKHAIGISLVEISNWNVFSYPAHRSDGNNPTNAPNRIAEGQRFRLDPSINVDTLNLSPAGKTIARAAQKYGFVVWDKAGSVSLRASNPIAQTSKGEIDPYIAVFKGEAMWHVLQGMPWDKLQFMPMNYGKP